MAKVLIVTSNFVPYAPSFGSCARCVYLTRFLSEQGHSVAVMASGGSFNGYFGHDDIAYKARIEYVGRIGVEGEASSTSKVKRRGRLNRFVRRLESRYIVPDRHVLKIPAFWKGIKQEIAEHSPDVVIVSVPPHGLTPLAAMVKRKYPHIKVVLDYRDSWNTTTIFSKASRLASWVSIRLEKSILASVDHFVHVSPVVPELIFKHLNVDVRTKSLLVMNGVPKALIPDAVVKCSDSTVPLIGYFGSVNDRPEGYRNIAFVFDYLNSEPSGARFKIWGELELSHHSLDDYSGRVEYSGQLGHKEAVLAAAECDALLIIHTDPSSAAEVIPGKFFDYLASKRPIICVAPPFAQVAKLVTTLGVGVVVDPTDQHGFLANFGRALKSIGEIEKSMADVPIENYTREAQFTKLLAIL